MATKAAPGAAVVRSLTVPHNFNPPLFFNYIFSFRSFDHLVRLAERGRRGFKSGKEERKGPFIWVFLFWALNACSLPTDRPFYDFCVSKYIFGAPKRGSEDFRDLKL